MKKYLVLFFVFLSIYLIADIHKERIYDNSDYFSLMNKYDINYSYSMNEGMPVMPAKLLFIEKKGKIAIDSIKFDIIKTDTIINFTPLAGENPLPLGTKPNKRSSLIYTKGLYPSNIMNIQTGQKRNNGIIFGNINTYQIDNNILFHHREIDINVFYTIETINFTKSQQSVLIVTQDSLKTHWTPYGNIYNNFRTIIKSDLDINSAYPTMDIEKGLRSYIQELYADSNLQAVIIGADTDIIPGVYIYLPISPQVDSASQSLVTDKYYCCLDGDWDGDNDSIVGEMEDSIDIFPDIFISRVPVRNGNDINNFLNKIITLKSQTGDTVLLAASFLDPYTDGSIAMNNIIRDVGIDEPIKKLYENDGNLSSTSFVNSINNSPFIVSHYGHGGTNGIQLGTGYTTNEHMDGLTNSIPTLLYSMSCWSAAYDLDCFAEHFLLSQGGGFYIGNSRYGWYTPYYPGFGTGDLCNFMFFHYFINDIHNPSAVLNEMFYDLSYQITHFNDYRWLFFVITYLGDPLINIYRNIDNIPLNTQTSIKNGCFSFTMPVYDSVNITVTGDSVASKSLYPHDNLFSCPIYNDDSLIVHIASINSPDTNIIVYTYLSDTIAYLTSYNCNYITIDTLQLNINLSPGFSGNFIIKPLSITDTLLFITSDSLYNLTNDTTLHFYFEINELPANSSQIPLIIDNDTLYLQLGNNFKSNIDISLLPDKIHYFNLDTIKPVITVKNTAQYTSKNLEMIVKSIALNYSDTIIIDSILPEQTFEYIDTLIADTSQNFADISITVRNEVCEKNNLFYISLNDNALFNDFETGDNYSIDSASAAFFHISTNEAASGIYSYFCGYTSSPTYPEEYSTTIYSPPFIYDTSAFLGFKTKYHVESGFDYCVVYLESGSVELPVATLSGESFGWEQYIFSNTDYIFPNGIEARLCFSFYSETDAYQFEGWYVDDVLLPGIEFYSSISEQPKTKTTNFIADNKINFDNATNTIYLNLIGNKHKYSIYDISGRIVNRGMLIGNNNQIKTNFCSGKYFLRIKSFDTDIIQSFTIIK